jgi:hypothetical protein
MKRKEPANISDDSRRELMVATWRALGSASVGAEELAELQKAIAEVFDEIVSPAGIARELSQVGAELRHPEIIESDARWRQAQIADRMNTLAVLSPLLQAEALNLREAEAAIAELENLRVRFAQADDASVLNDLKTLAIDARQAAVNRTRDISLPLSIREVQTEIAEWLRVWLETPPLFTQWLELRKGTKSFRAKFAED